MCDVTMGLATASAVMAGYGAYKSSSAQKESLKYKEEEARQNAGLQQMQVQDALDRGRQEAQDHMRQVSGVISTQKSVAAANGLDVSQGTPTSIFEDTQYMGNVDLSRINRNAQRQAWGAKVGATNALNTAEMLGATADNMNPGVDGLLSAAGSVANNWSAFSKK